MLLFELSGKDVSERAEEAFMSVPMDVVEDGELDGLDGAPEPSAADQLGLEQAVDRLGERVVVAAADGTDRRMQTGLGEPLGVEDPQVL